MSRAKIGQWVVFAGILALGVAWAQPPAPKPAVKATDDRAPLALNHRPAKLPARVSVSFKEMPLKDILEHLRSEWHVNILLDEADRQEGRLDPDSRISVRLNDVETEAFLEKLLEPYDLDFDNDDDMISIANAERLQNRFRTHVYPVADLVSVRSKQKWLDVSPQVIQTLQETIDRDIWEPNGGDATIQQDLQTLSFVVRCPPKTHRQIVRVLQGLRAHNERTASLLTRAGMPKLDELRDKMADYNLSEAERELIRITAPESKAIGPQSSESADRALKEATEARQIAEKALRLAVKLEAQLQTSESSKKK